MGRGPWAMMIASVLGVYGRVSGWGLGDGHDCHDCHEKSRDGLRR